MPNPQPHPMTPDQFRRTTAALHTGDFKVTEARAMETSLTVHGMAYAFKGGQIVANGFPIGVYLHSVEMKLLDLAEAIQRIADLEASAREAMLQVSGLTAARDEANRRADSNNAAYQEERDGRAAALRVMNSQAKEIERLTYERDEAIKGLTFKHTVIENLCASIKRVVADRDEARAKVVMLQAELDSRAGTCREQITARDEVIGDLADTIKSDERTVAALRARIAELANENLVLVARVSDRDATIHATVAHKMELERKLVATEEALVIVQRERDANAGLAQELNRTKTDLACVQANYASACSRVDSAKAQVANSDNVIAAKDQLLRACARDLTMLRERAETAQIALKDMTCARETALASYRLADAAVGELRSINGTLVQERDSAQAAALQYAQAADDAIAARNRAEANFKLADAALSARNETIASMEKAAEQREFAHACTVTDLNNRIASISKSNETLSRNCTSYACEAVAQKDRANAAEAELAAVRAHVALYMIPAGVPRERETVTITVGKKSSMTIEPDGSWVINGNVTINGELKQ